MPHPGRIPGQRVIICPHQSHPNLVDSYETINGLPIDKDPSYDPRNPYANRDPRLEQTIFHHGTVWGDKFNNEERTIDVTFGT